MARVADPKTAQIVVADATSLRVMQLAVADPTEATAPPGNLTLDTEDYTLDASSPTLDAETE